MAAKQTRHAVARSLDRFQDDPQRAPLREDEESSNSKGGRMYSSSDWANGALPGRLQKGARGMCASVGAIWGRAVVGWPERSGGEEPV